MDYIVYNKKKTQNLKADLKIFIDEVNEKLEEGYKVYGIYLDYFHLSKRHLKYDDRNEFTSICFLEILFDNSCDFFNDINQILINDGGYEININDEIEYEKGKMTRLIVIEKEK